MDEAKRKEIADKVSAATGLFVMKLMGEYDVIDDKSPEGDEAAQAVFAGVMSSLLWTMAGFWGSQPVISFTLTLMSDYVDRMVPLADAKHAELAALEEEKAAQQSELAAAQEAESNGQQP